MKNNKRLLSGLGWVAAGCLWWQAAVAQGVVAEAGDDRWRSSLFVYLWGVDMDGTAAVRGQEVDVDASFSDIVEDLKFAAFARFESHKGKWGYFFDGMYVKLDPEESTPIGNVKVEVEDFIGEVGGVYHFNPTVQGLFGVRYQKMEVDLKLPARTVGGDESWVDGFMGVRLVPVRNEKWRVWLRGDVDGGDSDFNWNAAVGAA